MRKIKFNMSISKENNMYVATILTECTKAVFKHPDRLASMKMGSSYAWERMK